MPLRTNTDLKSFIEQYAPVRLVKRATTGGGEYWSGCPWCADGTDRFHVWPYHPTRPHYWCRVCGRSGDAIQFARDWLDLDMEEACETLGVDPDEYEQFRHTEDSEQPLKPPCKEWQETGLWLIEQAEHGLWKTQLGASMLRYLAERGLDSDMVSEQHLGYIPRRNTGKWLEMPFAAWGLTDTMLTDEQRAQGCVKVPDGILIPWFMNGELYKLAIKRPEASPNYWQIVGSVDALYNADSLSVGAPVLVVEGEFDALSVMQTSSDLIACVATGSVSKGRDARWLAQLRQASVVLQGFDLDEAGESGADWWEANLDNVQRWRPTAHDPNDMLREKKDIRRWVRKGLMIASLSPVSEPTSQPLARGEPIEVAPSAVKPLRMPYVPEAMRYEPLTLDPLPRSRCPHRELKSETRYGSKRDDYLLSAPCRGIPGPRGWCPEHEFVLEQLDMGQLLGYPKISVGPHYIILRGKQNWEAHAEHTLPKRHTAIMSVLKWQYQQMYEFPSFTEQPQEEEEFMYYL